MAAAAQHDLRGGLVIILPGNLYEGATSYGLPYSYGNETGLYSTEVTGGYFEAIFVITNQEVIDAVLTTTQLLRLLLLLLDANSMSFISRV